MGKALQRRTVYAATIIAILAMVGGFALAEVTTTILISPTQNQNGFTAVAPGDTIYAGSGASVSSSLVNTTATGTCGVVAVSSPTATIYLSGGTGSSSGTGGPGVACQTVSPDWFEEFTFVSNTAYSRANPSDGFIVYIAGYAGTQTFTAAFPSTPAGTQVTTDIFIELGSSAVLTNSWVSIAVNGT